MRIFYAVLVLLLYAALCYGCWWFYRRAHPRSKKSAVDFGDHWLIVYASQSGTASQLAWRSVDQLRLGGVHAEVMPLNRLDLKTLQRQKRILFIASTFGEGEAPDNGNRFIPRLGNIDLSHLTYGLLALGDRDYRFFCGFGHSLNQALHLRGATPLFDSIEVNKGDPAALRHWQYFLGQISGQHLFHDWNPPTYESWRLVRRRCLNRGSPGAPAFLLHLTHSEPAHWQAGDIAEIGPCNSSARIDSFLNLLGRAADEPVIFNGRARTLRDVLCRRDLPQDDNTIAELKELTPAELLQSLPELPHREYSIASVPAQGTLDLLVRQVRHGEHELGLGSGWLTEYTAEGEEILLRVRSNPGFQPPVNSAPMILIGNGTGIAGLRAHLLARRAAGATRNWLLFGERTAAHDFFFGDDIRAWHKEGTLEHLDLVFSRDAAPDTPRYVQDLLPTHADRLHTWIADGAVLYVCGSLQGMAQGVDAALDRILGRTLLDQLAEARRYCRDVY